MKDTAIAIIGGTFNPFTNAHREMAISIRRLLPEVDIFYIPSNLGYIAKWKELPTNVAFLGENRVNLISQSIKDISRCCVSDIECSGTVSGRTYDTIQYFENQYDKIYICIGSDKLYEIEKWYKADELIEKVEIILFTRGEALSDCCSEFVKKHIDQITEIKFNYPEVSSSLVRDLYNKGELKKIMEYVPYPVYEYLRAR